MKIVGVQLDIAWEQPAENWSRVRRLLSKANVEPGSLIVLPEMFATGFSMQLDRTTSEEALQTERFLSELAKTHRSAVIAGVVGRRISMNQAANEALALDADGEELTRYRKMQPFTPSGESLHYAAGSSHRIFEWQGVQVAPFICYDLRFPEIFRPAARDGAQLFVVVANWPALRSEHWVRLLQARAIENQAYVVGINRCGHDPSLSYDGRSAAFDPWGRSLMELDERAQVLTCEIDAQKVVEWREQFPALLDMRIR